MIHHDQDTLLVLDELRAMFLELGLADPTGDERDECEPIETEGEP